MGSSLTSLTCSPTRQVLRRVAGYFVALVLPLLRLLRGGGINEPETEFYFHTASNNTNASTKKRYRDTDIANMPWYTHVQRSPSRRTNERFKRYPSSRLPAKKATGRFVLGRTSITDRRGIYTRAYETAYTGERSGARADPEAHRAGLCHQEVGQRPNGDVRLFTSSTCSYVSLVLWFEHDGGVPTDRYDC
jgi:hypothetical protein